MVHLPSSLVAPPILFTEEPFPVLSLDNANVEESIPV
jgi:hypothetical protein